MPSVYATEEDCNSELGKKMQYFRDDRPSEWLMDDFIRDAEKLDAAFYAAKAFIDSHFADSDISDEMVEKYAAYQKALSELGI